MLATLIGLNEAIVIQQVHYWIKNKEKANQDYIDGRYWVYNTYEQWQAQFPFWHINTIQRTFKSLEKKGLLIVGNYNKAGFDKTKWYTIDYDVLYRFNPTSYQNGEIVTPNWYDGTHQNDQTNTIDYTKTTPENTFNVLNGAALKQRSPGRARKPIDMTILEKQIIGSCHRHGIEDCAEYVEIIKYYYNAYSQVFHREHPILSRPAMDGVIEALRRGSDNVDGVDLETYQRLINQHFQTQYNGCDYNICHFMTEGIRNNRFYEACY